MNHHLCSVQIAVWLTLLTFAQSTDPSVFGYLIDDLRTNTDAEFAVEAARWTAVGLVSPSIVSYRCDTIIFLGGSNVLTNGGYFSRTYIGLPSHGMVQYVLRFTLIDDWSSGQGFDIYFDDRLISQNWNLGQYNDDFNVFTCGDPYTYDAEILRVVGKAFHSNSTLTIKIKSNMPPGVGNGAFGFRAFNLQMAQLTGSDVETQCLVSSVPQIFNGAYGCKCDEGYYRNPVSPYNCLACNAGCRECFGPSTSQCYGCNSGFGYDGSTCYSCTADCYDCTGPSTNQCLVCSETTYLYWDGTCQSSCPSGYTTTGTEEQSCLHPCEVAGTYLSSTGSCISTCTPPLVAGTDGLLKTCTFPCASGKRLYPDGSCAASCVTPWTETSITGGYACVFPCSGSTPYYYTSDGRCRDTCPSPFTLSTQYLADYCNPPCAAGQRMYPDGSCASSCEAPWFETLVSGAYFCIFPCSGTTPVYYPSDGQCRETCHSLWTASTKYLGSFCNFPCLDSQALVWNGECASVCGSPLIANMYAKKTLCVHPCADTTDYICNNGALCQNDCDYPYSATITSSYKTCYIDLSQNEIDSINSIADADEATQTTANIGSIILSLLTAGDPGAMSLAPLVKLLQYMKFLDISYPPKLYLTLEKQKIVPVGLTFAPKINDKLKAEIPKHTLPNVFEKNGIHSNFLVNMWEPIISLAILLGIIGIINILELLLAKSPNVSSIIEKAKNTIKWNFFLTVFCGTSGDLGLYTAIEFRTVTLDCFYSGISFVLCLLMNTAAFFILVLIVQTTMSIQSIKNIRRPRRTVLQAQTETLDSIKAQRENHKILFEGYHSQFSLQMMFPFTFIVRAYLIEIVIAFLSDYPVVQISLLLVFSVVMVGYLVWKRPMIQLVNNIQQIALETVILAVNCCLLGLAIRDDREIANTDTRNSMGNFIIGASLSLNVLGIVFLIAKLLILAKEQYMLQKVNKRKLSDPVNLDNSANPVFTQENMTLSQMESSQISDMTSSQLSQSPNSFQIRRPTRLPKIKRAREFGAMTT